VPPEWLRKDVGLSSDPELRRLQLRWFGDEIWMRRLVLGVALVTHTMSLVCLAVAPSLPSAAAAGVCSLISLPVVYFFGRGRQRRR
jgi:hypothetical protein